MLNVMMSSSNILVEDFVKLSANLKQKQKKRVTAKVSKRSTATVIKSERKVSKIDTVAHSNDLMKFETFELERTSTPNHINLCEHCKHSHAKTCCMYVYDDYSDILKYSAFKHHVEEPYYIVDNDENFNMKIGRTTPKHFPTFTENDSSVADMKMLAHVEHPPIVYLGQYLWPVYMPQYPLFVGNQPGYHPNNFMIYPQVNLPPAPYMPTFPMKHPPAAHSNFRHQHNLHPVETNNFVPMNFNNFWV